MQLTLKNAGKRFNYEWIFYGIDFLFEEGNSYAITGPNGSGKSTLLQVLAGNINLNEGEYFCNNSFVTDNLYQQLAITAPYLEVIEEMTGIEFLEFHAKFKPLIAGISIHEILSIISLKDAANKQIRFYSSGMKQRIKLAQAVFSNVPVLLLDEPCTNFDEAGYKLYYYLIENYCKNRLLIVSSNDKKEYNFCTDHIYLPDYKKG